jgi:tRNA-dihydrouridine synthase B
VDALHDSLLRSLTIGSLRLDRRLMMAPLAGISIAAFRREALRWGAGLVFTEMISAHGIDHENRRTLAYLACGADEHPIGFQLFAAEPGVLGRAARACVAAGADLVDLNMACPVRKVMKTGAGAALLGTPQLAEACVGAVVAAVGDAVPVTVKIRAGVRHVAAGAAAICVHPRYASQLYGGAADHAVTVALAAELPVPVIASGDIAGARPDGSIERETCLELLDAGVAAVMVARAAVGRPWVFHELLAGEGPPPLDERRRALRRFVDAVEGELGARSVGYLRGFWPKFRRSGALGPTAARALMTGPDMASIRSLLDADGV